MKLQGKVALVSGASRGIGREVALALGRAGAALALVARDEALLNEVAAQVGSERAFVVRADLADVAEARRAAEAAESHFGRIDVLVNNAGILSGRDFLESDPEQLARTVDVNVRAVVVLTRLLAEGMARRRAGHIVNIASLAAIGGMPGEPVYAGTKAALRLFTASLRPELEPRGIRLTDVVLGFTETEMLAQAEENPRMRRLRRRMQQLHLGDDVTTAAVAAAVVRAIERRQDVITLPARGRYLYLPLQGVTRMLCRMLAS